jgi:hypothetical protein
MICLALLGLLMISHLQKYERPQISDPYLNNRPHAITIHRLLADFERDIELQDQDQN